MRVTTRRKIRQAAALLLVLLLLPLSFPAEAAQPEKTAAHSLLENLPFSVDGGEALTVKTLHYSYGNNRYVSLRDVAYALSGTVKSFSLAFQDGSVYITSGAPYTPAGGEGQGFPAQTQAGGPYVFTTAGILVNPIFYNDRVLRYPNFLAVNPSGVTDCYLSVTDLALIMDLDLQVSADGMLLDTAGHFSIDLDALEREDFYCEVHSALVGDADTGEIYAAWEPDLSVPIASTTKLMTVLCLLDAAAAGEMTLEDTVTIPAEAAALSRSADGVIPMTAGQSASVPDLMRGMLLPSSNECALALAVHLDGSEEAFVKRMNRKAREIGLSDSAVFFNCHGLPMFTDTLAATKVQNRMTARDMFLLCSHLLHTWPEVTNITSLKIAHLETLNADVGNSNPLLYNIPGVVGLKTGTTNMSGLCLVAAMEAAGPDGRTHTLLAMEFGAEDSPARVTFSEELLYYGLQRLRGEAPAAETPTPEAPADEPGPSGIPDNAEDLMRLVLGKLRESA